MAYVYTYAYYMYIHFYMLTAKGVHMPTLKSVCLSSQTPWALPTELLGRGQFLDACVCVWSLLTQASET